MPRRPSPPPAAPAVRRRAATPAGRVPTFALYGEHGWEHGGALLPGPLHCESIASRSRLHGWEIRPHRHDAFFQILYIRAGSGDARFGERRVPIRPPCVLAVAPPRVHGFRFSRDVDGHVLTVLERHLQTLLPGAPELLARLGDAVCLTGEAVEGSGLGATLARLIAELEGTAPWRDAAVQAQLGAALVALARAVDALDGHDGHDGVPAAGGDDGGAAGRRGERHLRRFRSLVDRHFRDHLPIGFYAERLGITPTQLNRVCRDTLGRSALGVVNDRIRLEAERDLVYTSLDVKAIALQLGFDDAAYFTRFFAKQAGRTPTAFRAAARALLATQGTEPGGQGIVNVPR